MSEQEWGGYWRGLNDFGGHPISGNNGSSVIMLKDERTKPRVLEFLADRGYSEIPAPVEVEERQIPLM